MSEWFSFDKVLEKLEIKDFEIFQFLPQGLQPFTDQGQTPMKCPNYCHRYHQGDDRNDEVLATLKVLKPVIEQIEKLNPTGDKSVTLPAVSEPIIELLEDANMKVQKDERGVTLSYAQISYLRDLKKRYLAEKGAFWNNWEAITLDDQYAISWKYFVIPDTPELRQRLLDELRKMNFKKAEVETLKCTKTESTNKKTNDTKYNDEEQDKIILLSGYRHIKANIKHSNNWEEFHFNERQGKIVENLYNSPNYELHVKTLLQEKLSLVLENYRLDKQFKKHSNWRKLIMRTKKGYWRLNI